VQNRRDGRVLTVTDRRRGQNWAYPRFNGITRARRELFPADTRDNHGKIGSSGSG
jgi:hypothetical protein